MIEKLPVLPSYSSVAITCMVPANSGHTCIQTSPPESKKQQSGSFLLLRWQSVTENTSSLKVKKPTVAMNWNSTKEINIIYSVQFSCSVVSNSLQPHKSQHTRPPCPSQTPGVYSNSCLSSWWCHPAISSTVFSFSSCPQSLPASGSFLMSQFFTRGGQSIGVSASASVLPMNTQDWSPLDWTGWISLQSKEFSRVFSNNTLQKHQFFGTQLSSQSNTHIHTWPLEKR